MVLSGVGWICIFTRVSSECCRSACPWSKDNHVTVLLCVGVACAPFSFSPLLRCSGITGSKVLSRLWGVFEINYFSSVRLTPWITLGLKIFYPVVILYCKTVQIHKKKLYYTTKKY